jgi:hypothetical protein
MTSREQRSQARPGLSGSPPRDSAWSSLRQSRDTWGVAVIGGINDAAGGRRDMRERLRGSGVAEC